MLNTERLTIDECVDEIMGLLDDPTFEETPESQRVFGNLALTAHARAALRHDTRTNRLQVAIDADDGVVTLSGLVDPSQDQDPRHAVEVVSKVPAAKKVVNKMRMAVPGARHIVEG